MKATTTLAAAALIAISLFSADAFAQQFGQPQQGRLGSDVSKPAGRGKTVFVYRIRTTPATDLRDAGFVSTKANAEVVKAAQLAVSLHSLKSGVDCRLIQVVEAKSQGTAGSSYALKLLVNEGGAHQTRVAIVKQSGESVFTLKLWR